MAGYQFGHIATFSFQGNSVNLSIDEVAAEAARIPGSHPHVAKPLPPTLLAGNFRPEQVPEEIRRRFDKARDALKGVRTADGKIQRMRKDTHVMEAQVHSHPIYTKAPPPDHDGEVRPTMDDPLWRRRYLAWRSELVRWIDEDARRRGLEVLSVVEHLDEAHPHIHAMLVPLRTQQNPRMDAKVTHPGHAAETRRKAQARERFKSVAPAASLLTKAEPTQRAQTQARRGSDIGRRTARQPRKRKTKRKAGEPATLEQIVIQLGTRAHKAAMRGWQNHLFETLSFGHGLARVGPGLERLSRRAWWQRQTQSEAVMEKKELAATLATVADNFAGQAKVADQQRLQSETEIESLKAEIEALKTELAAANDTIRRSEELPEVIHSLEAAEAAGRQRLADVSADVAEAERKLQQAQDAEAARKVAEEAVARAEMRRKQAEAATASLEERETLVRADRKKLDEEKTALKVRERAVGAMLRGLAAWASGRLGVDTGDRLVILRAKDGRTPDDELASFEPAANWLVVRVKRLESMFNARLSRALDDAKKAMTSTIRAWATGLLVRDRASPSGVRISGVANASAREKLLEDTVDHQDVVISTLPLLPNLTAVHEVMTRAESMRGTLDAAELRQLNAMATKSRGLGGKGPGAP